MEAIRIVENAKEAIENEKMAAMHEMKNQLAQLSIEIAEKIIREELAAKDRHKQLIEKMLKEVTKN